MKRPPCPLHYRWTCSACGHLRQQQNRRTDPAPVCARCGGTRGIETPTTHWQMDTYEACLAWSRRPVEFYREPRDVGMLTSLHHLLAQIRPLEREYREHSQNFHRARAGSEQRAVHGNQADDTLLKIATLVRSWAHPYPAAWLDPDARGVWCPHGEQVMTFSSGEVTPVEPWPCQAYGCSLADFRREQRDEESTYTEGLWREVYGQ